jgi:hypothetical protein
LAVGVPTTEISTRYWPESTWMRTRTLGSDGEHTKGPMAVPTVVGIVPPDVTKLQAAPVFSGMRV